MRRPFQTNGASLCARHLSLKRTCQHSTDSVSKLCVHNLSSEPSGDLYCICVCIVFRAPETNASIVRCFITSTLELFIAFGQRYRHRVHGLTQISDHNLASPHKTSCSCYTINNDVLTDPQDGDGCLSGEPERLDLADSRLYHPACQVIAYLPVYKLQPVVPVIRLGIGSKKAGMASKTVAPNNEGEERLTKKNRNWVRQRLTAIS